MKLYPDDWRARLTTGVVVTACMAAAMLLGPVAGIHGFWPFLVAILVGIVLGRLVAGRLFPPSSGSPPDHPPQA